MDVTPFSAWPPVCCSSQRGCSIGGFVMSPCSSLFHSVAVISITTKINARRKILFCSPPPYHCGSQPVTEGSQDRNSRQERGVGTMEEHCLLPRSLVHIQLHFLYNLGPPDLTHSGLSPPMRTSSPGNPPQARLMEAILQLKVPLPRCVNLTTKISITKTRLGL